MKRPFLIVLFFSFSACAAAQTATGAKVKSQTDSVFTSVEAEPQFPGGNLQFLRYLSQNVRYPKTAYINHIQGRVIIQFMVQTDGSVADPVILRSVSPDIDAEAIRVVMLSPKWKPGIQNDKPVKVLFTVPITFNITPSLQKTDTAKTTKPQTAEEELDAAEPPASTESDTTIYTTNIDVEPEFPNGGISAFYNFLRKNIKQYKLHGAGRISFIVEKDGSISNITIVKSVDAIQDAENIRVMKLSPKWFPGMQGGKPVRVQYSIPIGNN